jgi:2-C-methyl-D-erythritol 2,4-cyclodiphosphate synthase
MNISDFRVGIGQDSHKFSDDKKRKLFLGGIEVRDFCGFKSNSDGDVVIHALCNAIEQAIGGNSLSVYSCPMCHDEGITDSKEYLKVAVSHMKEKGYGINNVGISVEAKFPSILPIAEKIRETLAPILETKVENIGINATSGEEMTSFGKGEGIQCFAVVSIIK